MESVLSLLLLLFGHTENKKITRIGFGSCIFPTNNKSILNRISDRNHDVFIMSGDATYLDYAAIDNNSSLGTLKGHFIGVSPNIDDKTELEIEQDWKSTWEMLTKDKHWINFKQNTNIISVWDDHDYGQNDGTFNNKYRDLAKQLYLDAMDVDANDERRKRDGVYYYYSLEIKLSDDITKIVDILLLDIRYFAKENGDEDILGTQQWQWLQHILRNKLNGDLALIVSGVQIMPISRKKTSEGWSRYSWSQHKLFELMNEIKSQKQQEIVLISGDVHRGEIMKMICKYTDNMNEYYNEFTEITSSGLTHSIGDDAPFIIRNSVNYLHKMESDGITECLWKGINFGEIDIEWNDALDGIKRININVLDDNSKVKCSSTIHPMINENKEWHKILRDETYAPLLAIDNVICYGGNKQYTHNEKYWKQMLFDVMYRAIPILPLLVIVLTLCPVVRYLWKRHYKRKRD